jgi:hypothetical protein
MVLPRIVESNREVPTMKKIMLISALLMFTPVTAAQASARDQSAAVQCWNPIAFPGSSALHSWLWRPCISQH